MGFAVMMYKLDFVSVYLVNLLNRIRSSMSHSLLGMFPWGLLCIAISPPIYFFPVTAVLFAFAWQVAEESDSFSFGLKRLFFFYCGYFIAIFSWLLWPITIDSHNWLLLPFVFVGVASTLSGFAMLIFAPVLWLTRFRRWPCYIYYCIIAVAYFLSDLLRAKLLFNGLPWNNFGLLFTLNGGTLRLAKYFQQWQLDLIVSFILAVPCLFRFVRCNLGRLVQVASVLLIWVVCLYLPSGRPFHADKVSEYAGFDIVGIQGDITAENSYKAASSSYVRGMIRDHYVGLVLAANIDARRKTLIILPEGAVVFHVLGESDRMYDELARLIPDAGGLIMFPAVSLRRFDVGDDRYYNALSVIDENGKLSSFHSKRYLVPFGEYIPFRSIMPKFVHGMFGVNDMVAVNPDDPVEHIWYNGVSIGVIICYEISFDHKLRDKYGNKPDLIISVANDCWIGRSIGLYQHLAYIKLRAAIMNRPVFHIANNGPSVLVDADGTVISATTFNSIASLSSRVSGIRLNDYAKARNYFFESG